MSLDHELPQGSARSRVHVRSHTSRLRTRVRLGEGPGLLCYDLIFTDYICKRPISQKATF